MGKRRERYCFWIFAAFFLLNAAFLRGEGEKTSDSYALPVLTPEELGFDSELTAYLEGVGKAMIDADETSGAVIAVGRSGGIAYLRAFGERQSLSESEPMTVDSLFDLASITKSAATSAAMAILYDEKKYNLDDPIAKYIPDFGQEGKDKITIRQCLTHTSGMKPTSILTYPPTKDEIWAGMSRQPLINPPGSVFKYSCHDFLILGHLVEVLSGEPLDEFTRRRIYEPLGMKSTRYCPGEEDESRIVVTLEIDPDSPQSETKNPSQNNKTITESTLKNEVTSPQTILNNPNKNHSPNYLSQDQRPSGADSYARRGSAAPGSSVRALVDDPQAGYLGGVAGNAGLFSTASDLAVFAAMMLGEGTLRRADGAETTIISRETFRTWTQSWPVPTGTRGLGWDKQSPMSLSNRAANYSPRAFGHSGFTGTVLWIDPANDLFVILLGNRLHPKKRDNAMNRRGKEIGTAAVDYLRDFVDTESVRNEALTHLYRSPNAGQSPKDRVLNGIDVLKRDGFALLAGKRVGLITNHTGLDADKNPTAVLMKEAGVSLAAIFSPEHGFAGVLEQSKIEDTQDPATGLSVYSLYGETRRPTPAMLAGIDVLVFDIQDVGARFYTYISTMGLAMERAAELGIEFVVLDRVNPISGERPAGPIADPGTESFVNFELLPVRHGMTVGEIAILLNAKRKLNLNLTVVPVENWKRSEYFDATNLPWVNPSPNMRSLTAAILYPGVCLAEGTGYSVGRGTETPFEIIGAPWIDGDKLAWRMNELVADDSDEAISPPASEKPLAGVRFEPITFTPDASLFKNQECSGLRFILTDREACEPVRVGIALMRELYARYPDKISDTGANHLLLNRRILQMIKENQPIEKIENAWQKDLKRFLEERELFLIYP